MREAAGRALKLRARVLLLALLLAASQVILTGNSFDLNEPAAEEEEEEDLGALAEAQAALKQANECAGRSNGENGNENESENNNNNDGAPGGACVRPSAEQLRKLQAMYGKILKLFEVLELCDDENFDIERVEIPAKWADQAKAMMVLIKVGKQKLIKRSDAARYKRIVSNCNQIDARVRAREEGALDLLSQMSGMTDEDVEKFKRDQEENVLDDLRNRFKATRSEPRRAASAEPPPARPAAPVRPLVRSASLTRAGPADGFVISSAPAPLQREPGEAPSFIQFL